MIRAGRSGPHPFAVWGWVVALMLGAGTFAGQAARAQSTDTDNGAAPLNQLTESERAEGWLLLFDGETLFGWRAAGKADWTVAAGEIRVTEGEVGLLHTTSEFADYELHVEFRADASTNSGIFLRTPPMPKNPAGDCYELNIAPPENPFPTGSFVARAAVQDATVDAEQWHAFDVRCEGGRFEVRVDGRVVLEHVDPRPLRRGYIGLQHNSGRVEFRNVKLKPLGLQPIFNGQDLSGWKEYPQMASKFTVTAEGALHVAGGRGQLESEQSYGDFVLQLDCQTHGEGLNSGVFFRCIPGDEMMGYETQIHNGTRDGDARQPADCGTGGIFRRQDARRIVAKDQEWFRLTVIALGPHIATWVNGFPVLDWSDTRKPDPNPRRGLRTAAGTLMLQGHDPTTDLSFRRLEIVELPPRR